MRIVALAATAVAVLALAGPATAERALLARTLAANTEWLSVQDARGLAVVSGRGALLGRVDRGFVVVTDVRGAPSPSVTVAGWERRASLNDRRTLYEGRSLSFRIHGARWRLDVAGRDVHLSAAVRGFVSVKAAAGRLALAGSADRALPDEWRTFVLDDPQPGWEPSERSLLVHEIRWLRVRGFTWAAIKETDTWRRYRALVEG